MTRPLSRLLSPASVAVIGGGRWGAGVVRECSRMGFAGPLHVVHASRRMFEGRPTVPSVADLPEPPDAAFLAVNARAVPGLLAELSAMGAGGAVCFASGFAETGADGASLQEEAIAAAGDMPFLGPNCYGLLNYADGAALWPDIHGGRPVDGGVAVVAQSSNILLNITMQSRGVPLAYAVAAGNQAQTSMAEIAAACVADSRVTAIGLHVEGIGDARAFEALAAAARERDVPVVVLRIGRSRAARAGAISHTASIAGGEAAASAFFGRLGFAVVETLPEFLAALTLLHVHGALPGRRIGSMSCSGGEANLVADLAEDRRVSLPALPEATAARLGTILGGHVAVANPLDYHTDIWGDAEAMRETFAAMLSAGLDLVLLILDFPRVDRCDASAWEPSVEALEAAVMATGGRAALVATLPDCLPEARAEALLRAGIAPLAGLAEALAAAAAAATVGEARARPAAAPVALPALPGVADPGPARVIDERMAKIALAAHGVPVPKGRFAANRDDAAAAAEALGGPVALKALGLTHKTEHGAIRLGLTGAAAVRAACERMAAPDGYLVEEMVEGGVAELLVGVARDPVHGLALTLGAGGVLTELMADSETLLLPATDDEIRAALMRLRIAPLLTGFRGRPAVDLTAAVAAISALQSFAEAEAGRLLELEVNPLIVGATGAVAVDALIALLPGDDGVPAG